MGDIRISDYKTDYQFKQVYHEPRLQGDEIRSVVDDREEQPAFRENEEIRKPKSRIREMDSIEARSEEIREIDEGSVVTDGAFFRLPKNRKYDKAERQKRRVLQRRQRIVLLNKADKPGKQSNPILGTGRRVKKAFRRASSMAEEEQVQQPSGYASAENDSSENSYSSWDYAEMSARFGKGARSGLREGLQEVLEVMLKVVKAVIGTALLPLILVMVGVFLIVAAVMSLYHGGSSSESRSSVSSVASNSRDLQMVTEYQILMEYFDGEEIPVMAIMCSLYREGVFRGNNLEDSAERFWNVTDEQYTEQINAGELSEYEFVFHYYNGVHYMYYSEKEQKYKNGSCGYGIAGFTAEKDALYRFAVDWFSDSGRGAGKVFDISDVSMQTYFMLKQMETTRGDLKEKLLASRSIEEASIWWVKMYEKPASDWEWSGISRAKDAYWIKEKCEKTISELEENDLFSTDVEIYLHWPLPAQYSQITSPFGYRIPPTVGASSDHKGIDIGAPEGTEVYAASSGRVVEADYDPARGNYVRIDHENGMSTLYQHLSEIEVSVGDMVDEGQVIARTGNTGISKGAHLHFEVWVDGMQVDPAAYLGI